MMIERIVAAALGAILSINIAVAKEPGIAVGWDPDHPNKKVAAVWLGYLFARSAYRAEHKVPSPGTGEIAPLFEEEVYARDAAAEIYQELRAKDKELHDQYWDDVLKVRSSGFMREYVWTYLKQQQWVASQKPKNLSAFQRWKSANLGNHRPQTFGTLSAKKE